MFGVGRHRETEGTGSDNQELRIGERRHATSGDEYAGSDRYAVRSVRSTARATASPPPQTERCDSACQTSFLQCIEQGGQHARARGAERVSQRDGAAIDV